MGLTGLANTIATTIHHHHKMQSIKCNGVCVRGLTGLAANTFAKMGKSLGAPLGLWLGVGLGDFRGGGLDAVVNLMARFYRQTGRRTYARSILESWYWFSPRR